MSVYGTATFGDYSQPGGYPHWEICPLCGDVMYPDSKRCARCQAKINAPDVQAMMSRFRARADAVRADPEARAALAEAHLRLLERVRRRKMQAAQAEHRAGVRMLISGWWNATEVT